MLGQFQVLNGVLVNVELERDEYKLRALSLSTSWMEYKAGDVA